MNKPFVVVNPKAKNCRVGLDWEQYRRILASELGDFEYAHTRSELDTIELTRKALKDGYRTIGSLGGDGTHSLVLNGFFEYGQPIAPDACLAILPAGTGGDFRRMLDIPGKEIRPWAAAMKSAPAMPIDVGHIRYVNHQGQPEARYFLNIASFGMGGVVDRFVNQSSKALGGKASFFIASIRSMIVYDAPLVTISVEGRELFKERLFMAAACNGQYFGGGMHVAPEARLDDGQLDAVLMPWRSRMYHTLRGSTIYSAQHLNLPGVVMSRHACIKAESEGECLLDIDGEAPGRLPAEITTVSNAIRLKAPLKSRP